ncbi:MAG TPA: J domain-containing protein [Polyangiaceae bacterium]|nr:J domain-containing protein [Polyangiaceae bacterium]
MAEIRVAGVPNGTESFEMLTSGKVRNPYEVLELPSNATPEEIRAAFRRLGAKHHPDRHQDSSTAHARFKEINAAYQILSDPKKRAAFDRFGSAAFQPGGNAGFDGVGFDTVVADVLRAMGLGRADGTVTVELELSFTEAAEGCTKEVRYERIDHCRICDGSAAAAGATTTTCTACGGKGRVRFREGLLSLLSERPCSKCRGTGLMPSRPCAACEGRGLTKLPHSLDVTIPPAVDNGWTQSVARAGHRLTPKGKHGKLDVTVKVLPHPFFSRSGDDVLCRVPISIVTAAVGGQVEIPTLTGKIKLSVPAATQPGSVLRVRGKGLAHRLRSGKGDQLVEIVVEVPSEVTPRARQLLLELGEELGRNQNVQPQQRSFMDKLRQLFD